MGISNISRTGGAPESKFFKGIALAAILSVALLLDHLGLPESAAAVTAAVAADLAARGSATRSTATVGDDIVAALGKN